MQAVLSVGAIAGKMLHFIAAVAPSACHLPLRGNLEAPLREGGGGKAAGGRTRNAAANTPSVAFLARQAICHWHVAPIPTDSIFDFLLNEKLA